MAKYTPIVDASGLVGSLYDQTTGKTTVTKVDNTNIIQIGNELKQYPVEGVFSSICYKIGATRIQNKAFKGKFMNLYHDSWEFGGILETLRVRPIKAVADPSMKPVNGTRYDQDTYYSRDVVEKLYTDGIDFQYTWWKPNDQLWTAFESMETMSRFISALDLTITNSLTVDLMALAKNAVANYIAQIVNKEFADVSDGNYSAKSGKQAINVLKLWNDRHPNEQLTKDNCRDNPEYLKHLVKTFMNYTDYLKDVSSAFNIDGEDEQVISDEDLNFVILSSYANDIKVNMQSDTYHKDLVALPNYETVAFWQGSDGTYDADSVSEIHVGIKNPADPTQTKEINFPGVVAVMFDKDAVGITCEHRKTTAHYNANIDQTQLFAKYYAQYVNKFDRNFVVFFEA